MLCASLLFVSAGLASYAQNHSYLNYTTFDGLTSNEVYHVAQDDQQRLLISSDHRLMRYDGQRFEPVPFEDPRLSGITIFDIKHDHTGRIWVSSYLNGLFYLEDDTLRISSYNVLIEPLLIPRFITDFLFEENGSLWFTLSGPYNLQEDSLIWYEIDPSGELREHSIGALYKDYPVSQAVRFFSKKRALPVRNMLQSLRKFWDTASMYQNLQFPIIERDSNHFRLVENMEHTSRWNLRNGPALVTDNGYWLASDTVLYHYPRDGSCTLNWTFNRSILDLFEDNQGDVFIGTWNGVYRLTDQTKKPLRYLAGNSVSDIYQDHEGGYWFATVDEGLFYLPVLSIHSLDQRYFSRNQITAIAANSNQLAVTEGWFGAVHLFDVEDDSARWNYKLSTEFSSKEIWLSDSLLYHNRGFYRLSDPSVKQSRHSSTSMLLDIEVVSDSLVIAGERQGISVSILSEGGFRQTNLDKQPSIQFTSAVHWVNGTIYMGTHKGVVFTTIEDWDINLVSSELPRVRISDIQSLRDSILVVSTKANGVYFIDLKTRHIAYHLDESNGLSSKFCSRLQVENDSVVWVGSNRGLNRIYLHKGMTDVHTFFSSDGLVSDKIHDLALTKGWLFAASEYGVSYFRPDQMNYRQLPITPRLSKVVANDSLFHVNNSITLQPGNRYLHLEYGALTFRKKQSLKYAYRIRELDTNWTLTTETYASFGLLPPGTYTFDLKAWYGAGTGTFGLSTYTLNVPPRFYERPAFRILIGALLLVLFAGGIYLYFRQRERERQQQWNASIAELKALSLQLNPHFLFNALNTILYLSGNASNEVTQRFVNDLSKLTRNILENSRQLLIPLDMELQNTQHYLHLEQLRFADSGFDYAIEVEPGMDPRKVFLPPLLLQPIVENALWHGLYPKKEGEKQVTIRCRRSQTGFEVRILDSGVGRPKPEKRKQSTTNKTSIGIQNARSRVLLYHQMGLGTANMDIVDLTSSNGLPCGTEVVFTFNPNTHDKATSDEPSHHLDR